VSGAGGADGRGLEEQRSGRGHARLVTQLRGYEDGLRAAGYGGMACGAQDAGRPRRPAGRAGGAEGRCHEGDVEVVGLTAGGWRSSAVDVDMRGW
jgi:hypothetical protein